MEIRSATIAFSKSKAKSISNREQELRRRIDQLDAFICDNFSSPYIDEMLRKYSELRSELKSIYEEKGRQAMFRAKCRWIVILKKVITTKKLSVSSVYKTTLLHATRQ